MSDDAVSAPIASLISKSEKAQQKVAPGTWQHTMLRDNLQALRLAWALMQRDAGQPVDYPPEELRAAVVALAAMKSKTAAAQQKFAAGTSQHSLLHNRLHALRVAEELVQAELERER